MSSSAISSSQRSSTLNTADNTPWPSPSLFGPSRFLSPRSPATTDYRKESKNLSGKIRKEFSSSSQSKSSSTNNSDDSSAKREKRSRKSSAASTSGVVESSNGKSKALASPYRSSSNASSRSLPEDLSNGSDQWWETVLPPGRLAERLRDAQAATRRRDEIARAKEGSSRLPRNATVLRNAPLSDRKVWTSLADYGQDDGHHYDNRRGGVNSTRSSIGSIPSIKSDRGTSSTASSSGAEDGPYERRSPIMMNELAHFDRSANSSPTLSHSVQRSTTSRRSRIMGGDTNDDIGLGIGASKANQTSVDFDERFRHWNFNHSPNSTSHNTLRPFPSSIPGRHSPLHTSLANTPEISSEEEEEEGTGRISRSSSTSTVRTTTTTKITRRITRASSGFEDAPDLSLYESAPSYTQTMPISSGRRQSWNPSMHNRHVSFNNDVEIAADKQWSGSDTIGRAAGRQHSHSMLNDIVNNYNNDNSGAVNVNSRVGASRNSKPFPSTAFSRGRRTPCYSAPTSPGSKYSTLHDESKGRMSRSSSQSERLISSSTSNGNRQKKMPDIDFFSSLGVSNSQLSSAGAIALNVTRQLSIPLKPMLHLTMFLSISSFTCFALAGFLIAGYFITAWDDVNQRGKKVQQGVTNATDKLNASLQWCEQLLTGKSSSTTSASKQKRESPRIVTAPLRFAIGVPATIAYKLTPTSISESLGIQDENRSRSNSDSSTPSSNSSKDGSNPPKKNKKSKAEMPPRPPLASLLPSIFLTILIAMGAGVVNFFAGRGVNTTSSPASPTFPNSPRTSSAVPAFPSSQIPIRKGGSFSTSTSASPGSSAPRRQSVRPYDVI